MDLPKILIIGQPFNNDTGGGITLCSLFNGWNRENIAVACSGYLISNNISTDKCGIYYQLGYKENKWRFPFNLIQRKHYSGILHFDDRKSREINPSKSKFRVKIIMNYFFPFLKFTGLSYSIYKTKLSDEFCAWVRAFDPDIIYAQATSRDAILFCISVYDLIRKPLVFHMMDDWPSTIAEKGLFKKYWHNKINKEFKLLLDRASLLLSICDDMAEEYKIRYNKKFITFHNTIDIEFWKEHQKYTYELNAHPTILYAGRVGMGIDTSLELIANAIQRINKELNISLKFILQTKEKPAWIGKYSCTEHKTMKPYSELPKTFADSDFLVLPYDFSRESIKFIKYSMPTKAPEYMISGTPIIIFAPDKTAIVEYAKKYGWAKIVTVNNIEAISDAIKHLIEKKEYRRYIAHNAIKIAEMNHNSLNITAQFRQVISSVAVHE